MCWKPLIDAYLALSANVIHRRKRREQVSEIEQLESRWVPAAQPDLTPIAIIGPDFAEPGSKIEVDLRVDNQSEAASPKFQVEYRLSLDEVADPQDVVVGTVKHKGIGIQGSAETSKSFRLPNDLAAGTYHLVAVIDSTGRVTESNEANNTLVATQTITIGRTSLTGRATFQKASRPVAIVSLLSSTTFIDPTLTTWIVIHGRNQSSASTNIDQLANQIEQYQAGDQVLLLDWGKAAASGAVGGQGENFIRPVAEWAAEALTAYGFTGQQLNLVGYSWGAEVAAELAEVIGTVNSIVAIDPARDFPGGSYNPEAADEVNFSAHADQSWAFYASSDLAFGSRILAPTAETAVVVVGTDHFGIVTLVGELIALPSGNPVATHFPLSYLLTGAPPSPWEYESYSSTGMIGTANGQFEVLLRVKSNSVAVESISFVVEGEEQTIEA